METQNRDPNDQDREQKQGGKPRNEYQNQNRDGEPNGAIPDNRPDQLPTGEEGHEEESAEDNTEEKPNPNDLSDPANQKQADISGHDDQQNYQ
ncbi:hypothetical protein [Pedobacter heparinus]|uniref:hypothetical protein n=1 Tax=Pedobacter heparinus TaxID=984 RepID=UPI00292DEE05|nr:hypothetical protein [Pedobacter heparinus]